MKDRAGLNGAITSLHDACWAVTPDVVEFLLANGAEFNARNESDQSPLHIACARSTHPNEAPDNEKGILLALLELLVRSGADVNAINRSGDSPLHILCYWQPPNELFDAVSILLANGANVDCYNHNNEHLVHALCRRYSHSGSGESNYVDTIKFVLDICGPGVLSIAGGRSDNKTPMQWAIAMENWDVVDLLRKYGAEE